jgi:hypothetical protein
LEEVVGIGRKCGAGEFLEEFKGGRIEGVGKGRRGPEAGVKVVGECGVGIEIGGKKVGGGKLGAFAEELGAQVWRSEIPRWRSRVALEGGKHGIKEGRDKIGAANGLAKVMTVGEERVAMDSGAGGNKGCVELDKDFVED